MCGGPSAFAATPTKYGALSFIVADDHQTNDTPRIRYFNHLHNNVTEALSQN